MTEAEGNGDVQVELVLPMKHEERPVQWICAKLSVSPTEVDFVEEASFAVLEDLLSQGGRVGEPELEGSTIQGCLGYAQIHTSTLRHGEVYDYLSVGGDFLGPCHHGVEAGPVEGVCEEWS